MGTSLPPVVNEPQLSGPPAIEVVSLSPDAERALRCGAALLDRSERGKLALTGDDAAECLNGQVTNDVLAVEPGCGRYATFLTTKGQMLGDLRIVRTADTFELDTERVSLQPLFDLLRVATVGHDAELHKRTLQRGLISLVGPRAKAVAQVEDLGSCEFRNAPFTVNGTAAHVIVTEFGVDILCAAEDVDAIKATLVERGATTITEPELEVARIAKGRPRFGVELDERTMPQEAGLTDRAVSFTKGCYVGQETVARLHWRGKPNRHLRGLRLSEPVAPGTPLVLGEREVGRVASSVVSPRLGPIALAILSREAEPGATPTAGGTAAEVVALPFA